MLVHLSDMKDPSSNDFIISLSLFIKDVNSTTQVTYICLLCWWHMFLCIVSTMYICLAIDEMHMNCIYVIIWVIVRCYDIQNNVYCTCTWDNIVINYDHSI